MRFEIFKGNHDQFFFHIIGNNGQKVAQSEGYTRKESAKNTIAAIQKSAATAEVVDQTSRTAKPAPRTRSRQQAKATV